MAHLLNRGFELVPPLHGCRKLARWIEQAKTDPAFAAQVLKSPGGWPLAVFYAAQPGPDDLKALEAAWIAAKSPAIPDEKEREAN